MILYSQEDTNDSIKQPSTRPRSPNNRDAKMLAVHGYLNHLKCFKTYDRDLSRPRFF